MLASTSHAKTFSLCQFIIFSVFLLTRSFKDKRETFPRIYLQRIHTPWMCGCIYSDTLYTSRPFVCTLAFVRLSRTSLNDVKRTFRTADIINHRHVEIKRLAARTSHAIERTSEFWFISRKIKNKGYPWDRFALLFSGRQACYFLQSRRRDRLW